MPGTVATQLGSAEKPLVVHWCNSSRGDLLPCRPPGPEQNAPKMGWPSRKANLVQKPGGPRWKAAYSFRACLQKEQTLSRSTSSDPSHAAAPGRVQTGGREQGCAELVYSCVLLRSDTCARCRSEKSHLLTDARDLQTRPLDGKRLWLPAPAFTHRL